MEADPTLVPVSPSHVAAVAHSMRQADIDEVLASCGHEPLRALWESIRISEASWTLMLDGQPAAILGTVPCPGGAIVWMLTSTLVERHPIAFLRLSRYVVEALLARYGALVNAIDARYETAIRWAKWLGFTVYPPEPFGVAGLPFCRIEIGGAHV